MDSNPVEGIKSKSNYLRGTIVQGLADSASGTISADDTQLSKFHGIYQQDDRDVREQRRRQMLEPDHSFMIRARVPGGVCTPEQWLALDAIANRWANGSLRLTTRQAFQFHGVLKHDLKNSIREINESLLDTIAACGDVNRNVMCTALPEKSEIHAKVYADAVAFSAHLTPNTSAYHEIWLDKEKLETSEEHEPIYGKSYLPRKFKTAFAVPPANDVDVLAHDLGFIAVEEKGRLAGYTVTVGGGMGVTHGDPATYPLLARPLGFISSDQVCEVGEAIIKIQRDFGDRSNRKHARFKYTVEDHGLDWLRAELTQRLGYELAPPRPFHFSSSGDDYGWHQTDDGKWHLLLFIQNGRIADGPNGQQLSGFREISKVHDGDFRLTANQNVIIAGVAAENRTEIDRLVREHGLNAHEKLSQLRLSSMACVAFPTCSQAMAEAERYLPDLLTKIEAQVLKHGLSNEAINIRMTGCPNGCARPYLAEIGLVGKAPGRYNVHLGAAHNGTRLNYLARENVNEKEILSLLDDLFAEFAGQREVDEAFGDFLSRIQNEITKGGTTYV
ncbi:MAG: sulfite reductase (NADPH) hemoprotein beta-component [Lysobacterales bacterium]|jgi:sulfite reductase (NADPH) hemoprotein beta-component